MFPKFITRITNKGLDQLGSALNALVRLLNKDLDFFKLVTKHISHFGNLQIAPHPLGWVEFRRITRQLLQPDPLAGPISQIGFDFLEAVGRINSPYHE